MITIRFENSRPLYKQIVEQILRQVKEGILKPGDRLPTERELAEQLQIARGTVKKAYKELADNNIIEVIQGSGSYIYNDRDVYDVEHRKLASQLIEQMLDKLESWNLSPHEISACSACLWQNALLCSNWSGWLWWTAIRNLWPCSNGS